MAPRAQVSASCDSLEAHFDDRQALRGQERQALTDAIEDVSFNPNSMGWDEPRNTRIHQKHCALRDVVFDLQAELQELINAAWSI